MPKLYIKKKVLTRKSFEDVQSEANLYKENSHRQDAAQENQRDEV